MSNTFVHPEHGQDAFLGKFIGGILNVECQSSLKILSV